MFGLFDVVDGSTALRGFVEVDLASFIVLDMQKVAVGDVDVDGFCEPLPGLFVEVPRARLRLVSVQT